MLSSRMLFGAAALAATALVLVALASSTFEKPTILIGSERYIDSRILQDQQNLRRDLAIKRQMRQQSLFRYPDGCVCDVSNCVTPNCDEEASDGPLCKCPKEGKQSMPGAATPWPMDAKFRGPAGGSLRQVYSNYGAVQAQRQPQQHAVARRGGKAVQHSKDSLDQAVMPPFTEEKQSRRAKSHFHGARTQQKWVGSPEKMLPPNGDYPGGATGIPEDGYLAFETGWGQTPYHGLIPPMQEAGIMERAQPQQLAQMHLHHRGYTRRPRFLSHQADLDERIPARMVQPDLFEGSSAGGPTLNAFQDLV